MWEMRVQSLGQEDPLEKGTQSIPVFLPGKFHGPMILAGYNPWDPKETDQTEQLTHTSNKLIFSSVQSLSLVQLFATPCQASLSTPTPRACSNSGPLSWWYHPTISSSVILFSSCPQSFPKSGSFPMSWLFVSGGQSTGASASASFLPKKSQGWSPSEWIRWISLQSKRLSRVFCNTTVQKYQFFSPQISLWSNSHIHTWLLEKP